MKKIILTAISLLSMHLLYAQYAPNSITRYEYWFDHDYANAVAVLDTANSYTLNVSTSALSVGMHTYNFRAKDMYGGWSSVVSQTFNKPPTLTTYRYWFDKNFGSAVTGSLSANQLVLTAPFTSSVYGFHEFHIQVKQNDGKWSSVVTQQFNQSPKLNSYEYWFDENYAAKTSQTFSSPTDATTITNLLNTTTLVGTHHSIHYRTHQQNGTWSTTLSQDFNKQNHIVAYEYWFNDNYAAKVLQPVTASGQYQLSPVVDASQTPLGSNNVNIHFKDENGKWGSVITDGFCHNTGDSSIHLKLYLQGYYAGGGTMTTALLNEGVGTDPLETDSIDVELRNENPPYQFVASTRASLKTDGTAKCDFPFTFIGSYYLAIKHRNTVETWSAYPIFRGNCPLFYDFTKSDANAFGNNMKQVETGTWAFFTGDINHDENVDLLDLSYVEIDINSFQYGYFATDINGDGNVDLLDSPTIEENVNDFVFSTHP